MPYQGQQISLYYTFSKKTFLVGLNHRYYYWCQMTRVIMQELKNIWIHDFSLCSDIWFKKPYSYATKTWMHRSLAFHEFFIANFIWNYAVIQHFLHLTVKRWYPLRHIKLSRFFFDLLYNNCILKVQRSKYRMLEWL